MECLEAEYIHTIVPNKKVCISKYRPLSRSYFKMVELIQAFGFGIDDGRPIQTFHLAEGPGGFIQAVVDLRHHRCDDRYYGMTLVTKNPHEDIPAWKKSRHFLRDHPNVMIETGADETGNLLSYENFVHVCNKYGATMDFITADGGFDFSMDFSHQEEQAADLIFAQISYAICLQKKHGCFVLKVYDMFTKYTVDMLALLASLYEQVYVTKPNTSRAANSEKYIVCKNFIMPGPELYTRIHWLFQAFLPQGGGTHCDSAEGHFLDSLSSEARSKKCVGVFAEGGRKLTNDLGRSPESFGIFSSENIPCTFMNKIHEFNAILGQHQIENIHATIQLIHDDILLKNKHNHELEKRGVVSREYVPPERRPNILTLMKKNIQKCIQWCILHHIPYEAL